MASKSIVVREKAVGVRGKKLGFVVSKRLDRSAPRYFARPENGTEGVTLEALEELLEHGFRRAC